MSIKSAYNVVFQSDGTVTYVKKLTLFAKGATGYVVWACSEDEAIEVARPLWNAYMCKVMARRRERLKDEGMCGKCGQVPPEEGFTRCRGCRLRESGYRKDRNQRVKDGTQLGYKRDESARVEKMKRTKKTHRVSLMIRLMLEVRDHYKKDSEQDFSDWLDDRIKTLQEGVDIYRGRK